MQSPLDSELKAIAEDLEGDMEELRSFVKAKRLQKEKESDSTSQNLAVHEEEHGGAQFEAVKEAPKRKLDTGVDEPHRHDVNLWGKIHLI